MDDSHAHPGASDAMDPRPAQSPRPGDHECPFGHRPTRSPDLQGQASSARGAHAFGRDNLSLKPASARPTPAAFAAPSSTPWLPDALQHTDESHLVAWSESAAERLRFAAQMQRFLQQQPGYEVCVLHGRSIATLPQLCEQLERQIPVSPSLGSGAMARSLDARGGVIDLLRSWEPLDAGNPGDSGWWGASLGTRRRARYFLWTDPEHLFRADGPLFARVVDAMLGVAAEGEFGPAERLMIQRVVFCGGPLLERLATDPDGPFQRWWDDGSDSDSFWSVISGLDCPPVTLASIEDLMNPAARASA